MLISHVFVISEVFVGLLREWSNQVWHSLYIQKHISYDDLPFFENV